MTQKNVDNIFNYRYL